MTYPLVRELAADGIPVAVTCGVLGFARQAYYAWRSDPISDRDWEDAHTVHALHQAHLDDPTFGYRLLADELEHAGVPASENRVHRLCREHKIWSTTTRKGRRGGKGRPGPPVHNDLVQRDFDATIAPTMLWLTDITEHPTRAGKLYMCAIKDARSNRIVGWAIDSRIKARLAVAALEMAVATRQPTGPVIVHADRGSQFRSRKFIAALSAAVATRPIDPTRPWRRSAARKLRERKLAAAVGVDDHRGGGLPQATAISSAATGPILV